MLIAFLTVDTTNFTCKHHVPQTFCHHPNKPTTFLQWKPIPKKTFKIHHENQPLLSPKQNMGSTTAVSNS